MPSSSSEGKEFVLHHIRQIRPHHILDVGVGCGTYSDLIRDTPIWEVGYPLMHGVEVWLPYVERFNLTKKYDLLTLGDARQVLEHMAERRYNVSTVILGDILEHMTKAEALALWVNASSIADEMVVLSIPIRHYPQGAEEGNPYEVHVKDDWTHEEVMETFPGITDSWQGTEVGVYVARVW